MFQQRFRRTGLVPALQRRTHAARSDPSVPVSQVTLGASTTIGGVGGRRLLEQGVPSAMEFRTHP
jgi:hypothetical protein